MQYPNWWKGEEAARDEGRRYYGKLANKKFVFLAALVLLWTTVVRVGEASNPGPRAVCDNYALTGHGAARYPKPLRPGFRNVRCSGFEGGVEAEAPMDDLFQLKVATVNATAWTSAWRYLERTEAQVVLVQETKVLGADVPKESAKAMRRGWQTIWTGAKEGKKGRPSGGAVICVKQPVCLSAPPRGPSEVVAARVVAGMIQAPGCRPTMVYAGYLKDGIGAKAENLQYLASMGAHKQLQPQGTQAIFGADFHFWAEAIGGNGFPCRH